MHIEVVHRPQECRYIALVDGQRVGFTIYRGGGDRVSIPYTEVAPAMRGRGIAAAMVRAVLEDMRARGVTVVPSCSYVASFVTSNPEFVDVLVPELRSRFGGSPRAA